VYGQTIDKVVGDIREYLPDVSDVTNTVKRILDEK
jgi:hypothetical protein